MTTRPTIEDLLARLEASRAHGQVHVDDEQQCSSDLSSLQPAQGDLALLHRGVTPTRRRPRSASKP